MARTQAKPRQDGPVDEKVKDRPVKVIRLRNIRGNIWANRTTDGRSTFYTVTFDRIWKEDDEVGTDGNSRGRANGTSHRPTAPTISSSSERSPTSATPGLTTSSKTETTDRPPQGSLKGSRHHPHSLPPKLNSHRTIEDKMPTIHHRVDVSTSPRRGRALTVVRPANGIEGATARRPPYGSTPLPPGTTREETRTPSTPSPPSREVGEEVRRKLEEVGTQSSTQHRPERNHIKDQRQTSRLPQTTPSRTPTRRGGSCSSPCPLRLRGAHFPLRGTMPRRFPLRGRTASSPSPAWRASQALKALRSWGRRAEAKRARAQAGAGTKNHAKTEEGGKKWPDDGTSTSKETPS